MKKSNFITVEFLQMCAKVAEQTDRNDHTGAKVTVAKYFDLKHFIKVFEFVEFLHGSDGSMLEDLRSIRLREGKRMMLILQQQLTEMQFQKLNNSF
jgi:uncharacterized protein YicC (UPF0701 family)